MRRGSPFKNREISTFDDCSLLEEPFVVDKNYTYCNTTITSKTEENDYLCKMFYNTDPLRYGVAWPSWYGATPSVNEGYHPDWWQGGGGSVEPRFGHPHGSGMSGVNSIPIKVTHEKSPSAQSSCTEKSEPKVHHVSVSLEPDPLVSSTQLGLRPQCNYFQNIYQDPLFNTENWRNSQTISGLKQTSKKHNLIENDCKQTGKTVVRHVPVTVESDSEEIKPKLLKLNGLSPHKKKKESLHIDRLGNINSQEKKKSPVDQQHGGANASCQHTSSQVSKPVDPLEQILTIQKELETLEKQVSEFSGTAKDKNYRYLDEMLTRCMLRLDNIDTHGEENIRKARKAVVNKIQAAISQLDAKVTSPKNEIGPKETLEASIEKTSNSTEQQPNIEEEMEVTNEEDDSEEIKMDEENKEVFTVDDVQVEGGGKLGQTTNGTDDGVNEESSMNVDGPLGQSEGMEETTTESKLTDGMNEEPSMSVDIPRGQSEETEQAISGLQQTCTTENLHLMVYKEKDAVKCTVDEIEEGTLTEQQESSGEEKVQGESQEIQPKDRSNANKFVGVDINDPVSKEVEHNSPSCPLLSEDVSCIQSDNSEIQMGEDGGQKV